MKNHTKITPQKQRILEKFMALDKPGKELVLAVLKATHARDIPALCTIRDSLEQAEPREAIDGIIDCLQVKGGAK